MIAAILVMIWREKTKSLSSINGKCHKLMTTFTEVYVHFPWFNHFTAFNEVTIINDQGMGSWGSCVENRLMSQQRDWTSRQAAPSRLSIFQFVNLASDWSERESQMTLNSIFRLQGSGLRDFDINIMNYHLMGRI